MNRKYVRISLILLSISLILTGCLQNEEPDRSPTTVDNAWISTKNTTRINSSDPYELAVLTSQTLWTLGENNQPGGVIIVNPNDWQVAAVSADLIHFPNNGPVLFAAKDNIPDVTLEEIKRLNPKGPTENNGVQVILVGEFEDKVMQQVDDLGFKADNITAANPYDYAKQIDAYYAEAAGSYPESVIVGSAESAAYTLPAVNWIAHAPEPLLLVNKDEVPKETQQALEARNGNAKIYLLGPESVVSSEVEAELAQYGAVQRISGNDEFENAIAFAKYSDPDTGFGWGITTPGHNVSMIRIESSLLAVAAAPFSHLGKHAPMLWTEKDRMPDTVMDYLMSIQPKYQKSPAEGPYNHAWIIGGEDQVSYQGQVGIDDMLEIISGSGQGGHSGH